VTRLRNETRVIVAACTAATFFFTFPVLAGSDSDNATRIRDLYYGEALFHFYQQDDFTALTHLLAARQAGRVSHHAAEAELLLGGLYLSYGQHNRASAIFDRLLNESVDSTVRDRAWFYLGKVRYQRGLFEAAEQALFKVEGHLPGRLDAERYMLLAQSYMGQGRFDAAAKVLDSWKGPDEWLAYARYNLGVSLVRLDRVDEGARFLDQVGRSDAADPEQLSLRDKANLALGYAYLQSDDPEQAKSVLQRVRLMGPFSNKALLGVGWADAIQEDYRSALIPWLELKDRDLLDSAVQESLLAIPYAFGRLDANGSAAEHYLKALATFDQEMVGLDDAIRRAGSGELVPAMLSTDDTDIGRWYWQLEELPDSADARYLYFLVADHDFQEGLRSYRDLIALRGHLDQWQGKLGAFSDMIETRAQAYEQRLPAVEDRLSDIDIAEMRARRDEIVKRLADIGDTRDIVGLASHEQLDYWTRLDAMESVAAWDRPELETARHKQRILKGTLLWDLDRDYKYRLWKQQREITGLDEVLARAESYQQRTNLARSSVPKRVEDYRQRIAMLSPRLEVMQSRIDAALGDQQQQLQILATRELEAQKERLATYRVQARFALANIYDRATVATTD